MARSTINKTVRVKPELWSAFTERCKDQGISPNAALVGFITDDRAIRMAVAVRSCERFGSGYWDTDEWPEGVRPQEGGAWVKYEDLIKLLEIEGG